MLNNLERKADPKPSEIKILLGRLELAVKGSGFGIWEFELQTGQLIWDSKMAKIYGYTNHVFDKNPNTWKACIHHDDIAIVDEKFNQLMQGQPVEIFEFRIFHFETKELRFIEANGALETDANGQPYRLVGMNRDVTDKKLIENNLEAERIARITTSKMAALGEMASGIAHEINNPLMVVKIGAAKINSLLQKNSILHDDVKKELTKIDDTVGRIAKIIKSLQNFSRNSQLDQLEPTLLKKVIDETLSISQERLYKLNIHFQLHLPDESLEVLTKPVELSQVLLNLLNNSVDAVQQLETKWIEIRVTANEQMIEIRVIDSGSGIPEEVQAKMMQPFYTSKPIGQGTGLGLSISKGIINSHRGELLYESTHQNTCFVIRLPNLF